jgi:hypothetical protein
MEPLGRITIVQQVSIVHAPTTSSTPAELSCLKGTQPALTEGAYGRYALASMPCPPASSERARHQALAQADTGGPRPIPKIKGKSETMKPI